MFNFTICTLMEKVGALTQLNWGATQSNLPSRVKPGQKISNRDYTQHQIATKNKIMKAKGIPQKKNLNVVKQINKNDSSVKGSLNKINYLRSKMTKGDVAGASNFAKKLKDSRVGFDKPKKPSFDTSKVNTTMKNTKLPPSPRTSTASQNAFKAYVTAKKSNKL